MKKQFEIRERASRNTNNKNLSEFKIHKYVLFIRRTNNGNEN